MPGARCGTYAAVCNGLNEHEIFLDEGMIDRFEKSFDNPKMSDNTRQAMLLGIVSTLLHEEVHKGRGDGFAE